METARENSAEGLVFQQSLKLMNLQPDQLRKEKKGISQAMDGEKKTL